MAVTLFIYYKGKYGGARMFAQDMEHSGTADAIRAKEGCLAYEYFITMKDPETLLLVDSWATQEDLDAHHASPEMETISRLREKYDLHMEVKRCITDASFNPEDEKYIRK